MPGISADIELVRPAFGPTDTVGVEAPREGKLGTITAGLLVQYEDEPLVLYRYGDEDGTVIRSRTAFTLGASLDFSKRFGARLTLPLAYDFPGTEPDFQGDAFGVGDIGVGARAHVWRWGPIDLGAHADVLIPTGTTTAWKGEGNIRGLPGVLVAANYDIFSLRSDTAFMLRGPVDTNADFTLGTELVENAAFVADLWPEHFSLNVGVVSRVGLTTLTSGGAENVAELLAGTDIKPAKDWTVSLTMGRGLTEGYGTTRYRVVAGVTWSHVPKPPPKPEPVVATITPPVEDLPDSIVIDKVPEPPPPPKEWSATELARLEQDQIVIRDPIQFEFAKDVILPVSLPTLKYVGSIMNAHPDIVHVVIEGHASEEGSYYYNYDLAKKRADAIWRALIEAGVSPTRISTRSMGEVEPKNGGEDETSLAENRRVEFHIVKRLEPGETPPEYKLQIKQPWTGEPETLPAPPPPPPLIGPDGKPVPVGPDGKPLAPPPPPGVDDHTFDDDEDGGKP